MAARRTASAAVTAAAAVLAHRLPPTDAEERFELEVRAVRDPSRLAGTGRWRFRVESAG